MFKDVFISHAKEDYPIAEKIYDFLESHNYSPWLDKKKFELVRTGIMKLRKL